MVSLGQQLPQLAVVYLPDGPQVGHCRQQVGPSKEQYVSINRDHGMGEG